MNRILIADPDPLLSRDYSRALMEAGLEVRTTHSALDCLFALTEYLPDVLVLDPDVLWGRGEGILALLRDDARLPHVAVILNTSRPLHRDECSRFNGQVKGRFDKPVPPVLLIDSILKLGGRG